MNAIVYFTKNLKKSLAYLDIVGNVIVKLNSFRFLSLYAKKIRSLSVAAMKNFGNIKKLFAHLFLWGMRIKYYFLQPRKACRTRNGHVTCDGSRRDPYYVEIWTHVVLYFKSFFPSLIYFNPFFNVIFVLVVRKSVVSPEMFNNY